MPLAAAAECNEDKLFKLDVLDGSLYTAASASEAVTITLSSGLDAVLNCLDARPKLGLRYRTEGQPWKKKSLRKLNFILKYETSRKKLEKHKGFKSRPVFFLPEI